MNVVKRGALVSVVSLALALFGCDDSAELAGPADELLDEPPKAANDTYQNASQFAELCLGKKVRKGASPYKQQPGKVSPVAVLVDAGKGYSKSYHPGFDVWKANDVSDVQLVACVARTQSKKVKDCAFKEGQRLEMMSASYSVALYDAASGKELKKTQIEKGVAKDCPIIHAFSGGAKVEKSYPRVEDDLVDLIDGFQPADSPAPKVNDRRLRSVCEGKAARGAAAVKPGSPSAVKVYYRLGENGPFDDRFFSSPLYDREKVWDEAAEKAGGSILDTAQHYPLVACMTGKKVGEKKECAFNGGKSLDLYQGQYLVEVIEARTGKKVASETLNAQKGACPFVHDFSQGSELLADPKERLVTFIDSVAGK